LPLIIPLTFLLDIFPCHFAPNHSPMTIPRTYFHDTLPLIIPPGHSFHFMRLPAEHHSPWACCNHGCSYHIYTCVMFKSAGAVTVFIDVCSFFMADCYTFPVILDNCCRGWVNNIIFTSSAPYKVIITSNLIAFWSVHVYVHQYSDIC